MFNVRLRSGIWINEMGARDSTLASTSAAADPHSVAKLLQLVK